MALLSSPVTQAADHLDSTSLATNPMADLNDVYAWMTSDGTKINLAMTVSPFDNGEREFGPSVQYAFHLTRYAGFPATPQLLGMGEESRVICTFASNTDGQCWVVDAANKLLDYVKGDFSAATGQTSASGNLKVFAGRRSDPFFFNLAGFLTAKSQVTTACADNGECPGNLPVNAAGCPSLGSATVAPLRGLLSTTMPNAVGPCPANQRDCFAAANVMAIVVQVDASLVTTDDKQLLGVWGSTHAGQ
jgi:hypothetical protein